MNLKRGRGLVGIGDDEGHAWITIIDSSGQEKSYGFVPDSDVRKVDLITNKKFIGLLSIEDGPADREKYIPDTLNNRGAINLIPEICTRVQHQKTVLAIF